MTIAENTLFDLVIKNFVEISKKRVTNNGNYKKDKEGNILKFVPKLSIASILINKVINEVKDKNKEKESEEEALEETIEEESEASVDKKKLNANAGYGTIKTYSGISPYAKYADYSKIWGHLGTFRTYNMFENIESNDIAMKNGESSRQLTSERTMDMGARNFKYFGNNNINNTAQDMNTITSLVPPVGANIDSKEWEKYALMMKMSIYQPLIALKFKFA